MPLTTSLNRLHGHGQFCEVDDEAITMHCFDQYRKWCCENRQGNYEKYGDLSQEFDRHKVVVRSANNGVDMFNVLKENKRIRNKPMN